MLQLKGEEFIEKLTYISSLFFIILILFIIEAKWLVATKNLPYLIFRTMSLYLLMHTANHYAAPLHIQLKNFL